MARAGPRLQTKVGLQECIETILTTTNYTKISRGRNVTARTDTVVAIERPSRSLRPASWIRFMGEPADSRCRRSPCGAGSNAVTSGPPGSEELGGSWHPRKDLPHCYRRSARSDR